MSTYVVHIATRRDEGLNINIGHYYWQGKYETEAEAIRTATIWAKKKMAPGDMIAVTNAIMVNPANFAAPADAENAKEER